MMLHEALQGFYINISTLCKMFNNASHGYFIKLLKLMALCAVGNLKTDSLKRLEVKVYTVLPMENNFLFIFVTQFEHGEASVSAACK